MDALKQGNDVVFFQRDDLVLALGKALGGEFRGTTAGMGGVKHWLELPQYKADFVHDWLATFGRDEQRLLLLAQVGGWGMSNAAYFEEVRRALNLSRKSG